MQFTTGRGPGFLPVAGLAAAHEIASQMVPAATVAGDRGSAVVVAKVRDVGPTTAALFPSSLNVALVPGAAGQLCCAGTMPTSGVVAGTALSFGNFRFSSVPVASVTAANLASFDTVALLQVNTGSLSGQQRADINAFVDGGGKLIVYDAGATSGQDYSWLIRPFSTFAPCPNCGLQAGTLSIVENNGLGSADTSSSSYVNAAEVPPNTDAVAEANMMSTRDPSWFGHLRATNTRSQTGWVHTYAASPSGRGLILYNGLDSDAIGSAAPYASGIDWLAKLWYLELSQQWNPPGLAGTAPIAGAAGDGTNPAFYGTQPLGVTSRDPVNLATGVFTHRADDFVLPGRVLGVSFTRWYNSADATTGPLGPAWTHSYNWTLTPAGASVVIRRGDGQQDIYTRNADGTYADPPNVFDTLTSNVDGTFTLTLTNQVAYSFSTAGQLTRVSEPAGNRVTLGYTAGKLTGITDSVGRAITLGYDTSSRLTSVSDPLGRRVVYAYDSAGRLATVTDKIGNATGQNPALHQWKYGYDGTTRHMTTITDPDGRVLVTNSYDGQGSVSQQRDGLGRLTTMSYSVDRTTLTDPRGHPATYTFDSRARVLTQSDLVGGTTFTLSSAYDAAGNRTSVTDRRGKTTDFTYDSRGNVLTRTDPSPDGVAPRPLTVFTYDAKNNLGGTTDAKGFRTTLAYDLSTNVPLSLTRQIDASTSAVTKYEYLDAANPGLPTRIIAPRGNPTSTPDYRYAQTLSYDSRGNMTASVDADGAKTTYGYDSVGRRTSMVDPDGNAPGGVPAQHTWLTAFDQNDRIITQTDPLGHSITNGYDGAGDRTALTDRNGNLTTYIYDANERLQRVQQKPDPVHTPTITYTTAIGRDANGNVTLITQGNGVATDYAFDELNRPTAVTTHPTLTTNLTMSYVLDGNGQPTSRTTGDGVVVSYQYDGSSRLTAVSAAALNVSYAYDELGRKTSMTDGTGTTTYQYDGVSRLTQVAAPAGTLGYGYDLDGNRTTLTYPGNLGLSSTYSFGGRLSLLSDWAGTFTTPGYSSSGRLAGITGRPGSVTYGYDEAQRVISVNNAIGSSSNHAYTLDAAGNQIGLSESLTYPVATNDTFAYTYDGLSRVGSVAGPIAETFALDGASNLTSRGGPVATYSYDAANRLLADGTQSFAWSGADRLTQRGTDSFIYDALGRMTSATVGGVTRTYAYNGDGLLASRTEGGVTTSFLWDVSVSPAVLVQAGADRVIYAFGPRYMLRGDNTMLGLSRDRLGSIRLESDDSGFATKSFRYAAYGAIAQSSGGSPTLLGFAGELQDPSGLIYLRARWYDPNGGRFLSHDAASTDASVPGSLNAFGYAGANPVLRLDPTGLAAIADDVSGCGSPADCTGPPAPSDDHGLGYGVYNSVTVAGGATLGPLPVSGAATYGQGQLLLTSANGLQPLDPSRNSFEVSGSFAAVGSAVVGSPTQQGTPSRSGGAYVGATTSVFLTNATQVAQLRGAFETYSLDFGWLPFGPTIPSVSFGWSGPLFREGIWIATIGGGPSVGGAVTKMTTWTR